jgi:Ca2+:H+ antiporter
MLSILRRELHLAAVWGAALLAYFAHDTILAPAGAALEWARYAAFFAIILWGAFAAVRHAEALAHHFGEPYGTLVLTLAVTVIEVAFILTAMLGGHDLALARDTVFAIMMVTVNGIAGLSLLLGGLRHGEQEHNLQGTRSYLAVIVPLSVLALILPNFTTATPGPTLSVFQSWVLAVGIIALYAIFLAIQTSSLHRYFLEPAQESAAVPAARHRERGETPGPPGAHAAILILTLLPLIYLAESLAQLTGRGLRNLGAPEALAGVVVASLVLAPEGLSALRAALRNELQRAINGSLGAALAAVGLTIPAVLAFAAMSGGGVPLGLAAEEMLLLLLTFLVTVFTFGGVRTNVLVGSVHVLLFIVFIALIFDP